MSDTDKKLFIPHVFTEKQKEFLMMPVQEMGLTTRSSNCLIAEGLYHGLDVCAYNEIQLRKIPSMGKASVNEVKAKVAAYDLDVKRDYTNPDILPLLDNNTSLASSALTFVERSRMIGEIVDAHNAAVVARVPKSAGTEAEAPPAPDAPRGEKRAFTQQQIDFLVMPVTDMQFTMRVENALLEENVYNGWRLMGIPADKKLINIGSKGQSEINETILMNGFDPTKDRGCTLPDLQQKGIAPADFNWHAELKREQLGNESALVRSLYDVISGGEKMAKQGAEKTQESGMRAAPQQGGPEPLRIFMDQNGGAEVMVAVNFPQKYKGRLAPEFMREAVEVCHDDFVPDTVHRHLKTYFRALAQSAEQNLPAHADGPYAPAPDVKIDPEHHTVVAFKLQPDQIEGATQGSLREVFGSQIFRSQMTSGVESAVDDRVLASLVREDGQGGPAAGGPVASGP